MILIQYLKETTLLTFLQLVSIVVMFHLKVLDFNDRQAKRSCYT